MGPVLVGPRRNISRQPFEIGACIEARPNVAGQRLTIALRAHATNGGVPQLRIGWRDTKFPRKAQTHVAYRRGEQIADLPFDLVAVIDPRQRACPGPVAQRAKRIRIIIRPGADKRRYGEYGGRDDTLRADHAVLTLSAKSRNALTHFRRKALREFSQAIDPTAIGMIW
jgi:hypothetical protein